MVFSTSYWNTAGRSRALTISVCPHTRTYFSGSRLYKTRQSVWVIASTRIFAHFVPFLGEGAPPKFWHLFLFVRTLFPQLTRDIRVPFLTVALLKRHNEQRSRNLPPHPHRQHCCCSTRNSDDTRKYLIVIYIFARDGGQERWGIVTNFTKRRNLTH